MKLDLSWEVVGVTFGGSPWSRAGRRGKRQVLPLLSFLGDFHHTLRPSLLLTRPG